MMQARHWLVAGLVAMAAGYGAVATTRAMAAAPLGAFADHGDVGVPSTIGAGTATYDGTTKTYTIAGGGENMWGRADHFHYAWIKMSGDVSLAADIVFLASSPSTGAPDLHRKACLIIRQSLEAD